MHVILSECTALAYPVIDPQIGRIAEELARLVDDAPVDDDSSGRRARPQSARALIGGVTDLLVLSRGYEPAELAPKIVLELLRMLKG